MESSATSMVVEAALSALLQHLFDKLAALPFLKNLGHLFGTGVEKEAKKLSSTLLRIQSLLTDAENRKINDESVRLWLGELKDVAYHAEDILDELEYRALESKIEEEAPIQFQTRKRKFHDLFSRVGSNFDLGSRIKEIREGLEAIENKSNGLHLKRIYKSERLNPSKERPPTSSFVDESTVIGRDADKEKAISLLKSDNDHSSSSSSAAAGGRYGLQVIPICGMGGLGKTTLAQMVYNDERVNEHFEVRAWVYVSQDFDLIRLSKAILLSFSGSSPDPTNLDLIQVGIKKALNDKKFLLVLDDVWNDNCNDWDALRAPLMSGARGSRILVTTRSQRVSSIVGTVPTHFLQGLSDDECWSLFERRAFVEGNSDAHSDLKKIGEKIVKKCNGLPLAVKSLGGLLRSKVDVVQWEAILESEIWGLSDDKNDILPALRLSYHHLPAHLKRCFAYCCMFGKGFQKDGDELVLKWMAQGYIQSEGSKHMEDIGWEYLDCLVSWSLLDTCPDCYDYPYIKDTIFEGGCLLPYVPVRAYTMHDLSHDLARSVLGAEFLDVGDVKSHKNVEKACHISHRLSHANSFDYEGLCCFKSLRTHMLLGYMFPSLTYNIPADFFINLTHLRLLELRNSSLKELPESIGNLIHLRLLDLSRMKIKKLPESITRLYHLQTLILNGCSQLVELPIDFSNLVNLRHMSLRGCRVPMPPGIGRLTNLHEMEEFNVKEEIGWRINELKDMIYLRGPLRISKLENVVNVHEAKEAELNRKPKIHRLQLQWKIDDVELRPEGIEEEVLEALQPHTNLKELDITGYCSSTFPRWLGDSSFSNLFYVSLYRCKCPVLPPFGQLPALKTLYLGELFRLEKVDREFYGDGTVEGGFPSLQELTFESMPDLEAWSALEGVMSHVSTIFIRKCSKLRELPPFSLTLKRVEIRKCERLATPSISRLSTIRDLTLSGCDQQMLSSVQYLTSLSSLSISAFPNLTSLPTGLLQPLTALEELEISECNQLMSLSEEVGLLHLTSLRSLTISDCCNLNCMTPGLQHLTSLESLKVSKCPRLTSLVDVLPTTLRRLRIWYCRNLNCLPINLTSLVELRLAGCPQIHSLPEELPTTLQSVYISKCPILTSLPTGLQNLSSLTLQECPKIHSLPEELPTTLQRLEIAGCPLLQEKCQKGGDYWCKISHIRLVIINEEIEKDDLD